MKYGVRLNDALKRRASEVVVGAKDGEFGLLKDARHILHAEIKLVITHGTGVAAHAIHQFYFDVSFEHGVVRRAL